jgi:hypothetical protein
MVTPGVMGAGCDARVFSEIIFRAQKQAVFCLAD